RRKRADIIDTWFWNKHDRSSIALAPYVDKELVKHYVRGKVPEVGVPETYAVYRDVSQLSGYRLDRPFVAKPTHSSGVVVLKPNGGSLDEGELGTLAWALRRNFYIQGGEIQYRHLEPKLIVEEFVGQIPNPAPDFKFQFYKGYFQHCFVLFGRHSEPKPLFLDRKGEPFHLEYHCHLQEKAMDFWRGDFALPECYEEMVRVGEILAEPFTSCRVDLFPQEGRIHFNELTFSPANCLFYWEPKGFMDLVGPTEAPRP
ncbi:MAG: ATP-grasp fold amidoligase family protein, partial [Gemmatimonadota bacterium]